MTYKIQLMGLEPCTKSELSRDSLIMLAESGHPSHTNSLPNLSECIPTKIATGATSRKRAIAIHTRKFVTKTGRLKQFNN